MTEKGTKQGQLLLHRYIDLASSPFQDRREDTDKQGPASYPVLFSSLHSLPPLHPAPSSCRNQGHPPSLLRATLQYDDVARPFPLQIPEIAIPLLLDPNFKPGRLSNGIAARNKM